MISLRVGHSDWTSGPSYQAVFVYPPGTLTLTEAAVFSTRGGKRAEERRRGVRWSSMLERRGEVTLSSVAAN